MFTVTAGPALDIERGTFTYRASLISSDNAGS